MERSATAVAPRPGFRVPRALRDRLVWPAAAASVLAVVYVTSLLPGVGYSGDTARFQFVGATLSTPHTTGYPTYVLLNAAWVRLVPVGSLAWRANLLSAVCAVAAVAVLVAVQRRLGVRGPVAALAALVFGVTYTLWSQATVAEVYTLHLLAAAAVLFFLTRWLLEPRPADLLAACAVYAVSFGNHMTSLMLLPAVAYAAAVEWRRAVTVRHAAWAAAWIAIGAAQYGYLVWRTYDPPAAAPLGVAAHNLREFWWVVSGEQWQSQMFAFGPAELVTQRLPLFARYFGRDFAAAALLVPLGVAALRPWRVNVFLLLAAAGNGFYALTYDIPDVFVYLLPSYLVAAVYLGVACEAVLRRLGGGAAAAAFLVALAALPPALYVWNRAALAETHNGRIARRIEANLATAGRDAYILVPEYEEQMYYWYYLYGEGWHRRNIRVEQIQHAREAAAYARSGDGPAVYCHGPEACAALAGEGLRLIPRGEEFYEARP